MKLHGAYVILVARRLSQTESVLSLFSLIVLDDITNKKALHRNASLLVTIRIYSP